MASYVASLFIAFIAVLACQMTTGRELKRESKSDEETATKYSGYVETKEKDEGKWLNENEETNGTGDTQRNSKESDVELVSRHFDTSPLTLSKFMKENSNSNEDNRHVTDVADFTDSPNSRRKIQETEEESRPQYSTSSENINKDAKGNEGTENSESREKCSTHERECKECKNISKMAALRNMLTEENISTTPEGVNSSTEVKSVNDTEKLSTPNRMKAPAKLLHPSMPSDTQDAMEQGKMKYHPNSKRTIPPMLVTLYKKLVPSVTDLPDVIESNEEKTEVGSDSLNGGIESDTLTPNVMNQITARRENKDWRQHGKSLLESLGTLNFADSEKVNDTLTILVDNAVNSTDGKPIFQDARASQAPQSRLYVDDTGNEKKDGDRREIRKHLKKANERLINIIINNYPPHACNKKEM